MRRAIVVGCLLLLAGTSATGQTRKKTGPCTAPQTQFEMNQCAGKAYKAADATLNQVYQRLAAMLDDNEKAQLKEAQTAWLKYRDSNCEFVADQFKGGSMRPMIYAYCLANVTKKRTSELRIQIKERSH
jgi:uncharacterized protein YecT (DUF1311 family)